MVSYQRLRSCPFRHMNLLSVSIMVWALSGPMVQADIVAILTFVAVGWAMLLTLVTLNVNESGYSCLASGRLSFLLSCGRRRVQTS
eukprot:4737079-Amphidinium_carterae.1